MNKIKIKNGETIAYRELGDGEKVLLCIHGNMCSSFEFETLMNDLSKENFKVICPDLRGFGESSYNSPVSTFEEYASDIIELINSIGLNEFSLLGHYIGGAVALEIASTLKEKVKKLILVSSVGTQGYPMAKLDSSGQPIKDEYLITNVEIQNDNFRVKPVEEIFKNKDYDFLSGVFDSILFNVTKPSKHLKQAILTDAFGQKSISDVYCALSNFNISNKFNGVCKGNNKIENITAETLVIQGSNDHLVPFDMAYTIKYSLLSKSKILTGPFGHSPFLDTPKWIFETILNF